MANEPRFADMPPARIVPMLADEGVFIASESTFQRVLRAQGQNAHRGRYKASRKSRSPTTHVAMAPRQLWCWDMTFLPSEVDGRWSSRHDHVHVMPEVRHRVNLDLTVGNCASPS